MTDSLSLPLARRVALAAQGFGLPRRDSVPGTRSVNALIERLGVLQIDSVNVFERSHYLPVFARLGPYPKEVLDRQTLRQGARHIEYWGHEATFMPREALPLFRWRMDAYRERSARNAEGWAAANTRLLNWLRDELRDKGPLPASEIEHDANKRSGPWWGWSDVKIGLETLFRWGDLVSAGRDGFERRYALPEQVLPRDLIERQVPRDDAIRQLVRHAAQAHGVGTLADIADYYRLRADDTRRAIADLVDAGELLPVTVEGWTSAGRPVRAWLHRGARRPRVLRADALLSPFDPVVWARPRAERLFGFHYRIEIYTPSHRRIYGYYVLPVLLDDQIAARVDLKSDRKAGVLRVQSAWIEPGAPRDTVERVAALVRTAALWQGLADVTVAERGDLAAPLATALRSSAADGEKYP